MAESALDPFLLEQVRSIELRNRMIVQSTLSGRHQSLSKLGSAEFSDYLEYSPGHDVRRIDWNVYAKSDRLYVRRYHDELALRVYLLLDLSKSMDYAGPPGTLRKYRYALFAATAIASIFNRQQDLVSLGFASSPSMIDTSGLVADPGAFTPLVLTPPSAGKPHLLKLFGILDQLHCDTDVTLNELLGTIAPLILPRSLVILFSDLIDLTEETLSLLTAVAARNTTVATFQVIDPWEATFPFSGVTTFLNPETGASKELAAEKVKKTYLEQFHARQEYLRKNLPSVGIFHFETETNIPFAHALNSFFDKLSHFRR